jgi:hypothetical protein
MGRLVEERFDRQLAINQPLVPCVLDETLEILAVAGQAIGPRIRAHDLAFLLQQMGRPGQMAPIGVVVVVEGPGAALRPHLGQDTAILWDSAETQSRKETGHDTRSNIHDGDLR